jgi:hypothetical protein
MKTTISLRLFGDMHIQRGIPGLSVGKSLLHATVEKVRRGARRDRDRRNLGKSLKAEK